MRKHLREVGRGVRVSRTSLNGVVSGFVVAMGLSGMAGMLCRSVQAKPEQEMSFCARYHEQHAFALGRTRSW